MNFLQDIPMKYFAVSFFDNSAAAQNHGVWAVEKTYSVRVRFFYRSCSAVYDTRYAYGADPALGDYIPQAPVNDEARKHNQNLPGMGGIFNHINCNLYAYGANNPVRYIDPTGEFAVAIPLIVIGAEELG